jgi:hypothetical protein
MVVAKDAFLKRASTIPEYKGFKAGVILLSPDGQEVRTNGLVYPNHTLIGGWSIIFRENREPLEIEVNFSEYAAKKSDGTLNGQWNKMPATMIRKVPLVQGLREAFPEKFQNMHDECELPAMGLNNVTIEDDGSVVIDAESKEIPQKEEWEIDRAACSECDSDLTPSVLNFSQKTYGKPLCFECQKTEKARRG